MPTKMSTPPSAGKGFPRKAKSIREDDQLDEERMASWIRQAASIPGWDGGSQRYGGSSL